MFLDANGAREWSAELRGEKLTELDTHLHTMIRVWGTYQVENNQPVIMVDRWERVDPAEKVSIWQGSLEARDVNGKNAYILTTQDGQKYILKASMSYPPEAFENPIPAVNGAITVEGVLLAETINGYPVIRDVMMDNSRPVGDLKIQSTQMMDIMNSPGISELISGQVKITQSRLVYLSLSFAGGHPK